jgi:hypothetical protein
VDPPLTPEQYRWLTSTQAHALRSDGQRRKAPENGTPERPRGQHRAGDLALGYGGLFRHASCGGTLRVTYSTYGKKEYVYYGCQQHMAVPERCPAGLTVTASVLDTLVWDAVVREVLLVPGRIEELAEEQRRADMAGADPNGELQRLVRVQADLVADQHSLMDSVQHARDAYVRRLAEERLAQLGPRIAKAEDDIADAQRRFANEQQRQAILADVQAQVGRYAGVLELAHTLPVPVRVPIQRRVLRALGFRASVDKTADGLLDVAVELRLAAGQPGLWFAVDDAHAGAHDEPTGLFASISEQTVQRLLHALATALPDLRAQAQAESAAQDGHEPAPVGQVRFVTETSSPFP